MRTRQLFAAALYLTLLGSAACTQEPVAPPAKPGPALIVHGGPILTMEGDTPAYVEAVVVDNGKIAFAGSDAEAMAMKGSATVVKDLSGKAMLPGFVDTHGHIALGGLQAISANLLAPPDGPVTDVASLVATVKDWAAKNQELVKKADLIIGFGYDNSQLKERRHPTKEELDRISTTVPVIVIHQSGHLSSLNTLALERLGIDANTKDPDGGVIQRKPGGTEPNGTFEEAAHYANVFKLLGDIGPVGIERLIVEGVKIWARFGYTTGQEGSAPPEVVKVMRKLASEGKLPIDVALFGDVRVDRPFIVANASQTYTNHFRVAGTKLTIDGSPQGFTAWRDRPYYAPVGTYPKGYAGYSAVTDKAVFDAVDFAYANNLQIITHANGEKAGDVLIAALEAAEGKYGKRDRRPVLIHGVFEREDQVARYKALGVIPSLFTMHTFYWGDWHYEQTAGPEVSQNIAPSGWYRKAGMIFTAHHDAPVALPDSLRVLDATVNRVSRSGRVIGPDHRVDTYTALKALTIWGAYQYFEENAKGTIAPGKVADFVVLSADPLKTEPLKLAATVKVVETIKDGKSVYTAP